MTRRAHILTVAGLLVVGISGVCLRLAWLERERKRIAFTMSEMHSLGVAFGLYSVPSAMYPPPPRPSLPDLVSYKAARAALPHCPPCPDTPASRVHPYIRQFYSTRAIPLLDGWGHPLICSVSADRQHYTIISFGAERRRDTSCSYVWPKNESWHDLILVDGIFVSAPDGWTH